MPVGVLAHPPHHGGHGRPHRDLVLLDQLQGRLGGEATLGHHELEAGEQPDDEGGVAARHVEERRGEQGDVLPAAAVGQRAAAGHRPGDGVVHRVLQVGDHAAVGGDGALGPAGGAGRVEDDGVVVLGDLLVDEVGGGGAGELGELVEARVVGQAEVGGGAVDEEDVLEVGGLVERAGDPLEALAVGDEHLGAGVLQAVLDLVGGPPPVEARRGSRPGTPSPRR